MQRRNRLYVYYKFKLLGQPISVRGKRKVFYFTALLKGLKEKIDVIKKIPVN